MPLSEEEQRVLNEMEQTLYRHDPAFAARVKSESVYRYAGRFIRWSVVGFILGLVIMILWFTTSIFLGLLGVAIMFASLVVFSTNLRTGGQGRLAGHHPLSAEASGSGIRRAKHATGSGPASAATSSCRRPAPYVAPDRIASRRAS